jgi:hypothetical protein
MNSHEQSQLAESITTGQSHGAAPARESVLAALLLVSAIVLIGLVIVQLGRGGQRASAPDAAVAALPLTLGMNADTVAQVGEFSMLSFNAGSDDVVAVLDSRGEQVFVYRIENQREFKLLERQSLVDIFVKSRAGRK